MMLSIDENMRFTQVGKGTPMGELMRFYWHPIASLSELNDDPVKRIRLLGEDLTLYKDRQGRLGLVGDRCPHRLVSLEYGIPEQDGLRCPYHGWLYDQAGQCIEMPAESPESTFPSRVKIDGYPVEALGGLVFAYLGELPAPLIPRWDSLVNQPAWRQVNFLELPCNWLQCQENSLDPTHTEWLHGRYSTYVSERKGAPQAALDRMWPRAHHIRIGFDSFEYGIIKRRIEEGGSESDPDWVTGHPILFPNMLRTSGGTIQFRVPMDDTHTMHVDYVYDRNIDPSIPLPSDEEMPYFYPPLKDDRGKFVTDYTFGQDYMAWSTQGPVTQRQLERLGESDVGIIMFRRQLNEQLRKVARGEEPINVFRDPAQNQVLELPDEGADKHIAHSVPASDRAKAAPFWRNQEPWAGQGYRWYLRELEEREKAT